MRQCPACSALFADETERCPVDGATIPSADPLLGALLDGKYRLDAVVGSGAMGTVYRGEQLSLGRLVAIKVMRSTAPKEAASVGRFQREAHAIARLKHRNIVAVFDFGFSAAAGAYIVMEYLEGRSVRDEVRMRGALPAREAVEIACDACAAVQASHDSGILHRDLKTSNLFLEDRSGGRKLKVLDFGLAKLVTPAEGSGDDESPSTLTAAGVVVGTPLFMSPEQWLGDPLDARSDVYSLGCVLYEMVVGQPPFWDVPRRELLGRKLAGLPRDRGDLPPAVAAVLDRALAPGPSDRYQSAADFASALRAAVVRPASSATAPLSAHSPGRRPNLPTSLTSFVGRRGECAEIASLLGTHRSVTVTGPGGVGKTRLAVEVARSLESAFPRGVWFVDLGRQTGPDFVASAVADAIGLPGEGGVDAACGAIGSDRVLLVLDNCEHVLDAVAGVVHGLLVACPAVRVLATSREPLRISGECVRSLDGLSLAAGSADVPDAVQLFVERVRLTNHAFAPRAHDLRPISELCERLERLPLAIELAAACARILTVDEILGKLDRPFRLLTGGGRTAAPRHRTLRATIDWSFDLLSHEERVLLERFSVFAGGWTLEAAEGVVCRPLPAVGPDGALEEATTDDGRRTTDILEGLSRLVDKSLVIAEERDGDARYRMLETIREYAREKLQERGDEAGALRAHSDWYRSLAERGRDEIASARQAEWVRSLGLELENFRAAMRWSLSRPSGREPGLKLAAALFRFFEISGRPQEGCLWIESALALDGDAAPESVAEAHFGLAMLRFAQSDLAPARTAVEECLRIQRQIGSRASVAKTLNLYALVLHYLGHVDTAYGVQEQSLALSRELGLDASISQGIFHLGMLATARGDYGAAVANLEESASRWKAAGNRLAAAGALLNLCEVERIRGNLARAAGLIDECLAVGRELDAKSLLASSCSFKACVLGLDGDGAGARRLFEESLALHRETGNKGGAVEVVEAAALLASHRGDFALAVRVVTAASAARAGLGLARDQAAEADVTALRAAAREVLGDEATDAAEAEGRALELDRAVEESLSGLA
jgi:predicted ATPase/serine/threonine protein kinase